MELLHHFSSVISNPDVSIHIVDSYNKLKMEILTIAYPSKNSLIIETSNDIAKQIKQLLEAALKDGIKATILSKDIQNLWEDLKCLDVYRENYIWKRLNSLPRNEKIYSYFKRHAPSLYYLRNNNSLNSTSCMNPVTCGTFNDFEDLPYYRLFEAQSFKIKAMSVTSSPILVLTDGKKIIEHRYTKDLDYLNESIEVYEQYMDEKYMKLNITDKKLYSCKNTPEVRPRQAE